MATATSSRATGAVAANLGARKVREELDAMRSRLSTRLARTDVFAFLRVPERVLECAQVANGPGQEQRVTSSWRRLSLGMVQAESALALRREHFEEVHGP